MIIFTQIMLVAVSLFKMWQIDFKGSIAYHLVSFSENDVIQVSLILKRELLQDLLEEDIKFKDGEGGENCGRLIDIKNDHKKHITARFENTCKAPKKMQVLFGGKDTGYSFELPVQSQGANFKFAASSCANTGSHSQVFSNIKDHQPELFL